MNVEETDDIKQVMKYTDRDRHDFWAVILAWKTANTEGQVINY